MEKYKLLDGIFFYPQENLNNNTDIFHLHPELIRNGITEDGVEGKQLIFSTCVSATLKENCSILSIANGIDFGNYTRIGLIKPNQHEQAIIAKVRKYMKVMKIQRNKGNVGLRNFTLNKILAHAILFPHDSDEVAINCFANSHVVNAINIQFITEPNKMDMLIKDTLGSGSIFGRFHVVWQWLAVLNKIHPGYNSKNRNFPTKDKFLFRKEVFDN